MFELNSGCLIKPCLHHYMRYLPNRVNQYISHYDNKIAKNRYFVKKRYYFPHRIRSSKAMHLCYRGFDEDILLYHRMMGDIKSESYLGGSHVITWQDRKLERRRNQLSSFCNNSLSQALTGLSLELLNPFPGQHFQ
jgi:hypothetical protein